MNGSSSVREVGMGVQLAVGRDLILPGKEGWQRSQAQGFDLQVASKTLLSFTTSDSPPLAFSLPSNRLPP